MGRRGPKPKPTAIKIANGNPGKRSLNRREPKPSLAASLAPPAWLDRDAKTEWRRVVRELERLGLYTKIDRSLLIGYCVAYSDYKQIRQTIQTGKAKRVTQFYDKNGKETGSQVSGEWTVAKQALEQMRRCGAEFGMGPASRVNLIGRTDKPQTLSDVLDGPPTELPSLESLGAIQ